MFLTIMKNMFFCFVSSGWGEIVKLVRNGINSKKHKAIIKISQKIEA